MLDEDVTRLQAATGRTVDTFVDEANGWRLLKGAGTAPSGCVFFGKVDIDGRTMNGCTAHDARPAACRTYPFVLRRDHAGVPIIGRDDACPHRNAFDMPATIREHLTTLWQRLRDERDQRVNTHA